MSAEMHARRYVFDELERRGWSQQRLADAVVALGVPFSQVAVSRLRPDYGDEGRKMSVDEAVAIAEVLDVSLLALLGLAGTGPDLELARLRLAVRVVRAAVDELEV